CLAGPVVAAAVVLKTDFYDSDIIDSKKISENKREKLFDIIISNSLGYGFGMVCSGIIDRINILNATKQAMHIALSNIRCHYDKIIIDAVKLKNTDSPFEAHFKAEDKFIQVAAASILAKVYRDRLMRKMHLLYPQYCWDQNKGYGTKKHTEAIQNFGSTVLHRKTFLKGLLNGTD
ncbi:MAG: ribonuclease HII, partial [Calditerrivibrio sp.]|nr:ribonuclease HII [Calditerrivibrio sp.]